MLSTERAVRLSRRTQTKNNKLSVSDLYKKKKNRHTELDRLQVHLLEITIDTVRIKSDAIWPGVGGGTVREEGAHMHGQWDTGINPSAFLAHCCLPMAVIMDWPCCSVCVCVCKGCVWAGCIVN